MLFCQNTVILRQYNLIWNDVFSVLCREMWQGLLWSRLHAALWL